MPPSQAWKISTRSNARKAVTMPVLFFNPKPRASSSLRLMLAKVFCLPRTIRLLSANLPTSSFVRPERTMSVRWESSWPLFVVRSITLLPTAVSTKKESRLHMSLTGRMPGCVSSSSKLSWSMAPMFSKSTKKQSPLKFPMQTLKSCLQWSGLPQPRHCSAVCRLHLQLCVCTCFGPVVLALRAAGRLPALRRRALPQSACSPLSPVGPLGLVLPFCLVCPVLREPLLLTPLLLLSCVSSALSHLGSDGCFTTDCALHGTDTVASLPGIHRLLRRWKADALKTIHISVQEAVSSTRRHLLAKELRVCTRNTRGLLRSAASSQRPREKIEIPPKNCGKSLMSSASRRPTAGLSTLPTLTLSCTVLLGEIWYFQETTSRFCATGTMAKSSSTRWASGTI